MRLTMKERQRATAVTAARYQGARKKEKGVILDEFTKLTGYGRRYASYVLRCHGKKVRINETRVIQGDIRKKAKRKKHQIKGRGNTKPGTLLKNQIPIRTFSRWNEKRPGFVEIDLVGHDGSDGRCIVICDCIQTSFSRL